jgi:preprotein translocase subunit SecF
MGEHQFVKKLESFYNNHYKKLVVITQIMLFLSLFQIIFQVAVTGDFINKGISFKGGITVTINDKQRIDQESLKTALASTFPKNEINIRTLTQTGVVSGMIIEADFDIQDSASLDQTIKILEQFYGKDIKDYSVENISPSLSAGFFRQVAIALVIAFIFMGIVVVITFRSLAPSFMVILCSFSDIVETIAVVNLTGMKLGTASIAAFLMLIGYSVDTDILLTTKVLKQKGGLVIDRIWRAIKTGITMNMTIILAVIVAIIFTNSESVRQIMIITLIGTIIDFFNTWIQNVALLRWYLDRKERKNESKN